MEGGEVIFLRTFPDSGKFGQRRAGGSKGGGTRSQMGRDEGEDGYPD